MDRFDDDLKIISKMANKPTLSSDELKAKFDEAGEIIQDYINDTIVPTMGTVESDIDNVEKSISTINTNITNINTKITNNTNVLNGLSKIVINSVIPTTSNYAKAYPNNTLVLVYS